MRVVLLLDRAFARRERSMLSRLEVGLADEGVRVLHATPRIIAGTESVGLYSKIVGYDPPRFPVSLRTAVRGLVHDLHAAIGDEESEKIDVVHCFSPETWKMGAELASSVNAGLVLEVWSVAAAGRAADAAAGLLHPTLLVGDGGLMRAVNKKAPRATSLLTPWGVHGEPVERTRDESAAVGIAMLLDGASPAWTHAAVEGFARAARRDARLIAFMNSERATSHTVWKLVRKLGVADRVSLIPDAEARREPIFHLDVLAIAEPSGRLRSITLDAMARGLVVVSAMDPDLSICIPDVTARLVSKPDAGEWEESLLNAASASAAAPLRASAQQWVATNRSASGHVASVIRAYDAVLAAAQGTPATHAA